MKAYFPQIAGSITSSAGALTAWQHQLDWALRIGASVVAITVGVLTIVSLVRKHKKESSA